MFSYLIAADYLKQIQDANLQQIINSDTTILESAQLAAEAEAKSYLRQKYDTLKELDATTVWDFTKTYQADDTVYLAATAYSDTDTYALNDLTLQAGKVYICTTAIVAPEAFNPAHWQLLGNKNEIFYGKLPQPLFDYLQVYKKGDQVYWKGNNYTCQIASGIISPGAAFQQGLITNTPVVNVFPDDPDQGVKYWGSPTVYVITSGILPTDDTIWVDGDNRDQQLVMYFIDIALYHVHSRIAPRNIPELRVNRYHAAIEWLKMCADGLVTPELPILQPKQGGRIRFGGQAKAQNFY
jgi:phage gp36-like protein